MRTKRVIEKWDKTTLVVDLETREFVRAYAMKWGVSMQEATDRLLSRAICAEEGLEWHDPDGK